MSSGKRRPRAGLNKTTQAVLEAPDRADIVRKVEAMTPNQAAVRLSSVRAYRHAINLAMVKALRGEISQTFLREITNAAQQGSALLMTEKLLEAKGLPDAAPAHPEGLDGGARLPDHIEEYREVTVERVSGVGSDGNAVDTTTVTVVGGPALAAEVPSFALDTTNMHVPESLPAPEQREGMAARLAREAGVGSEGAAVVAPRDPFLDPGEVDEGDEP